MNATAERANAQAYTDSQVAATNANVSTNTASIAILNSGGTVPISGLTANLYAVIKYLATTTDNTATNALAVGVVNVTGGASMRLYVIGTLGDGDSTDSKLYTLAISRIAGAATKAVLSTASTVGATAGATANAVVTASVTAMTGGVGIQQTFNVQVKVARSAGTSDNHPITVYAEMFGNASNFITMSAV